VLGSLVAAQRPALPLGWLMLLVGLSNALSIALESWARWSVVGGVVPGGEVAYWAASWVWVPGYLLPPTLLLLLFPEGRAPTPRWRPLVWISAAVVVAATAAWALTPYGAQDFALPAPFADLRTPVSASWADTLLVVTLPAFLACVVASVASLVVRWRRTTGPARDPLRWMLVAGLLLAVVLVVALLLESDGVSLAALAMVPVPVAVALGVLRRGLWQLDLLLHRALVYAAMTLAVVVVYAALLTAAGAVLGGVGDDLRLVALVVTAVGTAPLRDRLQLAVNRLLYGARDEPLAAIRGLSDRLDAASHPAEVLPAIAETVTRALRLPHARIDAPGGRSYSSGTPSGREEELPLVYQGRRIGTLTVAPRPGSGRCWSRWRGRRPWPRTRLPCRRTSSAPASTWSSRARRSASGCAATSTTTWDRRWPRRR
jgi:two-component system NarL family sensor kinase